MINVLMVVTGEIRYSYVLDIDDDLPFDHVTLYMKNSPYKILPCP